MFIRTVKVKRSGVIGIVLAAVAAVTAVVLALVSFGYGKKSAVELDSEAKRQAFLAQMGWQVNDAFDEQKTVTIPEEWNEVYINYNKLQKQQGFDLTKYKGREADIYTYTVKNYPGHENEPGIVCHLMVYGGQLIGGDVCSTALDGFMQGLRAGSTGKDK